MDKGPVKLPNTRAKMSEATFYLRRMGPHINEIALQNEEVIEYYLSAFLSAGRSATLNLQAEIKGDPSLEAAYLRTRTDYKEKWGYLLDFFKDQRNVAIHARPSPLTEVQTGLTRPDRSVEVFRLFYFEGTGLEVLEGCWSYYGVLAKWIREIDPDFSTRADPPFRFKVHPYGPSDNTA